MVLLDWLHFLGSSWEESAPPVQALHRAAALLSVLCSPPLCCLLGGLQIRRVCTHENISQSIEFDLKVQSQLLTDFSERSFISSSWLMGTE